MNEISAFPVAPETFRGESREVDPGACFDWLRQGWAMFIANPGIWIGATVLLLVILMAISIVPLFGQIAAPLAIADDEYELVAGKTIHRFVGADRVAYPFRHHA